VSDSLTLSVIVVNWNVRDLLRDCLASLYSEMQLSAGRWEVLVVDNASSDGSADMVRREFPAAVLLSNPENIGFGRANNQAFRIARGEFILLLNPDTVVLDHAIDGMLDILNSREDAACLGCRLQNGDGSFQRWNGGNQPTMANCASHFLLLHKVLPQRLLPAPLYLEAEPQQDQKMGWVSGACMLLRRRALDGALFDDRFFMYCEDLDLCARLTASGWNVLYTPRVSVVHLDGRSLALQTSAIRVAQMRSLRQVFADRHSAVSLLVYDLVILAGFSMRYAISAVLPIARLGRDFRAAEERGRRFVAEAFRALMGRWYTD
jgi:N-acetylglucosaminyl-diphospho-decaprenol L-rhamnosyltransferase